MSASWEICWDSTRASITTGAADDTAPALRSAAAMPSAPPLMAFNMAQSSVRAPPAPANMPAGNFASSFTLAAACSARAVAMIGNGRAEPDRGCSSSMLPSSASSLRMS